MASGLCVASVLACLNVEAEDKVEPQAINAAAPTASTELDRIIAEKARLETLEKLRARQRALDANPSSEFDARQIGLEASGVLNEPELKVRSSPKPGETRADDAPDINSERLSPVITDRDLPEPGEAKPKLDPTKKIAPKPVSTSSDDTDPRRVVPDEIESGPALNANNRAKSERMAAAKKEASANDPEFSRLNDSVDNEAALLPRVKPVSQKAVAAQSPAVSSTPSTEPVPRFSNSENLEKDEIKSAEQMKAAEKLLAEMAEQKQPAAPLLKENPKDVAASAPLEGDVWQPEGFARKAAPEQSRIPKLPPSLQGARDNKGPVSKEEDPEVHLHKLLDDIARLGMRLKELRGIEQKKIEDSVKNEPGLNVRDERALKAISALLDAQPPGAVAVKVFDAQTKQPLVSRVQIIDATGTAARAPLKEGFWTRGTVPPVNVLPGVVRIEVNSGGRFSTTHINAPNVKSRTVTSVEVAMTHLSQLNFEARGWVLADLDIGLRARPGESRVWFGREPSINDLIIGAQAEGVRVLGVSLPLGDTKALDEIQALMAHNETGVLLLPVFPGPRHAFNGSAMGLGVERLDGLKPEFSDPETPLRDGFDLIRANGGLAVLKDLKGSRAASIEREILPLYRRLSEMAYFDSRASKVRLYGATEMPFDTITNAYDVMSFDGSEESESVWFNLLNEGAKIQVIGAGGGSLEGGRLPFGQTFIEPQGPLNRDSVMNAIQAGRTVVSFGPAVFCKIVERDMGPGSVLPNDGRALNLQVQAYSTLTQGASLEKIEIIRNGKVVFEQNAVEGEAEINNLNYGIRENANAWYVVRVTERIKRSKNDMEQRRRAWTSPIYFRGASFAVPKPALAQVHGVLRKGLAPVRGTVSALALGQEPVRVQTDAEGRYSITLPASGSLVFKAEDCEPVAVRVFEHERVQRALGRQLSLEDPMSKLAERSVFGMWRLLLSDLEWDVTLLPEKDSEEAPKLPEPE